MTRALAFLVVAGLVACSAPANSPSASVPDVSMKDAAPAASAPTGQPAPAATSEVAASSSETNVDHGIVIQDVRLIAGGRSSVDHIGPDAHDALMARFRAAPLVYLAEANARVAEATPRQLAMLYFEVIVELSVEGHGPEAAKTARQMLSRYRSARAKAVAAPEWDGQVPRLDLKIRALEDVVANGT